MTPSLRHTFLVLLLCFVSGSAAVAEGNEFGYEPWLMATSAHGELVRVPAPDTGTSDVLRLRFRQGSSYTWMPVPAADDWTPAPDSATIGFYKPSTVLDCTRHAYFVYFRTTLHIPESVDPATVSIAFGRVDDRALVLVNGQRSTESEGESLPLGQHLHHGCNQITIVLGDWCIEAVLKGVRFMGRGADGAPIDAVLRPGIECASQASKAKA